MSQPTVTEGHPVSFLPYVGATITDIAQFDTLPTRTVYVRDGHEMSVYRRVQDGDEPVWRQDGTTAKHRPQNLPLGGTIVYLPVGQTNGHVLTHALTALIASQLADYSAVTDGRHTATELNAGPITHPTFFEDLNEETAACIASYISGHLPAALAAAACSTIPVTTTHAAPHPRPVGDDPLTQVAGLVNQYVTTGGDDPDVLAAHSLLTQILTSPEIRHLPDDCSPAAVTRAADHLHRYIDSGGQAYELIVADRYLQALLRPDTGTTPTTTFTDRCR